MLLYHTYYNSLFIVYFLTKKASLPDDVLLPVSCARKRKVFRETIMDRLHMLNCHVHVAIR